MQNGRLESFNGKLREECLNVSWFQNLFDARAKIAALHAPLDFAASVPGSKAPSA
jgi:putative transposase